MSPLSASLLASALIGFIAIVGVLVLPLETDVVADMRIEPNFKAVALDETFTVDVIVESSVPVNVFAGKLMFDKTTLSVLSINYNTSIADLWAEEPWHSNVDGTVGFAGGTTRTGGFTGTDTLITVTFKAIGEGRGKIAIENANILQHDGLGTDATLAEPIDALFTVSATNTSTSTQTDINLIATEVEPTTYHVVTEPPSKDLNGDGKQGIADASIMLLHMGSTDIRYDFNFDGTVDLKDFNIVLTAR